MFYSDHLFVFVYHQVDLHVKEKRGRKRGRKKYTEIILASCIYYTQRIESKLVELIKLDSGTDGTSKGHPAARTKLQASRHLKVLQH
jgi:hypothetical protein